MVKIEPPLFERSSLMVPPASDEVEIALFGKGVGECLLIHLGDERYAVVDSFVNSDTNNPVVVDYLRAIGVLLDKIELVISTHWHSDHTAGLTEILNRASQTAKFITYPIIKEEKFNQYIEAGNKIDEKGMASTQEFSNVLNMLIKNELRVEFALHNRILHNVNGAELSHGKDVCFYALSPQDADLTRYLLHLNIPSVKTISYSFPDDNEISIVVWLKIGDNIVLLGGDLEEKADNLTGWKAVIQNHSLPGKADLFKVPHHGSENSHNADVWLNLLNRNPVSILSVFNRSELPRSADKNRIKELSSRVFIAGTTSKKAKELNKLTKDFGVKIKTLPSKIGIVRARKKISENTSWNIEQFGAVESL